MLEFDHHFVKELMGDSLKRICFVFAVAVFVCAGPSGSGAADVSSLSLRYGNGFGGTDFHQVDLACSFPVLLQPHSEDWALSAEVEGIFSVLTLGGESVYKPSVMPNLILSSPGRRVDYLLGIGAGVMFGDTDFNNEHSLGGPFFLQGQAGIRVRIADNIFIGYRYYHQSNGKIYHHNSGVNLNQVELSWKF